MPVDAPRSLTRQESELLDALLAHEFPGVEALREQAQGVLAKRGCDCGCGTIDLIPPGAQEKRSSTRTLAEVSGYVSDPEGEPLGGVLLWLKDGLLDGLEVYSYDSPLAIPPVGWVEWQLGRSDS